MFEKILSVEAKNKIQPIHWHDVLEIVFVLQGKMEIVRTNDTFYLKESDLFVFNRDDIHCVKEVSEDVIYIELSLDLKLFEQFLPGVSTLLFKCSPEQNDIISENLKEEIRTYVSHIVDDMKERNADEQAIIYSCLEILSTLKLGFLGGMTTKLKGESGEKIERLWKIVDYMYDHCQEKLLLKDVASHVYISEAYVSSILKEETGKSFEEFLAFIRSETSIHYLLTTKMSVTNIAYECGFSAPRYYNMAFEKYYGCTPKEYREKNINFFKLEKKEAVPYVKYDKNVSEVEVQHLLHRYNRNHEIKSSASNVEIIIDLSEEIRESNKHISKGTAIKCSGEELIYYSSLEVLKRCPDDLGITNICIDRNNAIVDEAILKKIASNVGMSILDHDEKQRPIELNKFFAKCGAKTSTYYKQKYLNEVEKPYAMLNEGVLIYKKGLETVLLMNNQSNEEVKYVIQYIPEDKEGIYVQKKQSIYGADTDMIEMVINSHDIDVDKKAVVEGLFSPMTEYQLLNAAKPMITKVVLQRNQICYLSIQKVNK